MFPHFTFSGTTYQALHRKLTLFCTCVTQIIQIGTGYLKTEGACYCGIGILFLLYGYFRAVERPKVSLLLTILSLGTRVVLAYACAPLFGVGAIWTAIPIGWAMADAAGIILLRRGERTNRMNEIM